MLSKRCHLASEALFENGTFMIPRQSPDTTSTFGLSLSPRSLRRPSPPHAVRRRSNHRRKKRTPIKPNWPKRRARGRKRRLAYVSGRDGIEVDNEREGGTGTREDMQEIESRTAYTRDAPTKYDVRREGVPSWQVKEANLLIF